MENAYLDKRNDCEARAFTCNNVNTIAGRVRRNKKYNLRLFAHMSGKLVVALLNNGSYVIGVSCGCCEIM